MVKDFAELVAQAEDRSFAAAELEELIDNGYAAVEFDGVQWTCKKPSSEGEVQWRI